MIESTGAAAGSFETPIGRMRFDDVLFTFVRALSIYQDRGELPAELKFAPAPRGSLIRDGVGIPADHAYFLLSTTYVITGTPRVEGILSEIRRPEYDDEALAQELCTWTYKNIAYEIILGQFTSEQVLDKRQGKCADFAALYLALARSAGIPAKTVTGFLIFDQPLPRFEAVTGITPEGKYIVEHGWTKVYLPPEGWVSVDPTAGWFRTLEYEVENRVYSSTEESWRDVLVAHETAYGRLI